MARQEIGWRDARFSQTVLGNDISGNVVFIVLILLVNPPAPCLPSRYIFLAPPPPSIWVENWTSSGGTCWRTPLLLLFNWCGLTETSCLLGLHRTVGTKVWARNSKKTCNVGFFPRPHFGPFSTTVKWFWFSKTVFYSKWWKSAVKTV